MNEARSGGLLRASGRTLDLTTAVSGGPMRLLADAALVARDVQAGGSLDATSTLGPLTLGTAVSGGPMGLVSGGALGFAALTTTAGDVTARAGGALAGGTVTAAGSASLTADGDNTGLTARALGGSLVLSSTGGRLAWDVAQAFDAVDLSAPQGAVTVNEARSGGLLRASAGGDISFTKLKSGGLAGDPGNMMLTAGGAVRGGDIDALGVLTIVAKGILFNQINATAGLNLTSSADIIGKGFTTLGDAVLSSDGETTLGDASAASLSVTTPKSLSFNNLTVLTAVEFAARVVKVGMLRQKPTAGVPLVMTLTGYRGSIGDSAVLAIEAPNGLIVPRLSEGTATITTTAGLVSISDATILNSFWLATAYLSLWDDNTSPRPVRAGDVQLYQPGKSFFLTMNGARVTTNTFVVRYGPRAEVAALMGGIYLGASLVRDIERLVRPGGFGIHFDWIAVDAWTAASKPVDSFVLLIEKLQSRGLTLRGIVRADNDDNELAVAQ